MPHVRATSRPVVTTTITNRMITSTDPRKISKSGLRNPMHVHHCESHVSHVAAHGLQLVERCLCAPVIPVRYPGAIPPDVTKEELLDGISQWLLLQVTSVVKRCCVRRVVMPGADQRLAEIEQGIREEYNHKISDAGPCLDGLKWCNL